MKNCLKVTPGGAGYVIRCTTCKEQQINAVYHGETGRALYSRLTEHMKGHQKKQEGNPLHKHDQAEHNGDKATYSCEPMGFFPRPANKASERRSADKPKHSGGSTMHNNELTCRVPTRFRTKDRDRKRNGEVGTSRQRSTQRTNTTPTCGSRAY